MSTNDGITAIGKVLDGLRELGIASTAVDGQRRMGQDGFDYQSFIDLDDKDGIVNAVAYIAHQSQGRPLTFSPLELPECVSSVCNWTDSDKRIAGRYVTAFDVREGKIVQRIDLLFKVN